MILSFKIVKGIFALLIPFSLFSMHICELIKTSLGTSPSEEVILSTWEAVKLQL